MPPIFTLKREFTVLKKHCTTNRDLHYFQALDAAGLREWWAIEHSVMAIAFACMLPRSDHYLNSIVLAFSITDHCKKCVVLQTHNQH